MAKADLTAQRLRELLHYDPETGVFTWLVRPAESFFGPRASAIWHTRYCGKRAGCVNKVIGYATICILDKAYYAHRLAWLYASGTEPIGEIDHINGEKADNRLGNLRDVSPQTNKQNMRSPPNKVAMTSIGVYYVKRDNLKRPYSASIALNGRHHHLGYFATNEEAHAAYLKAKRVMHVGCTI